jgi:hypothetical protein
MNHVNSCFTLAIIQPVLTVALNRSAGNTFPACPQAEPCNGGFIGIEWVIEDFTKSELQQSWWTVVLDIQKVPPWPSPKRLRAGRYKALPVFPPSLFWQFIATVRFTQHKAIKLLFLKAFRNTL